MPTTRDTYVLVTGDGNPQEVHELPGSVDNISGFPFADEVVHQAHGYWKARVITPDHDPATQRLVNGVFSQQVGGLFVMTQAVEAIPAEEQANPPPTTEQKVLQAKALRYQKLSLCDWVELPSVRARCPAPYIASWDAYRDAVRHVTDGPDPDAYVWPTAPHSPVLGPDYEHGTLA